MMGLMKDSVYERSLMEQKYKVKKVLNNNVVQASSGFREVMVVGLGIGFNAKLRSIIPNEKIEKIFELKADDYYKASQLVQEIPNDLFFKLYLIIEAESIAKQMPLSHHAYLTLIDHLHFAHQRLVNGQKIKNYLMFDLEILYTQEFQLAGQILKQVNKLFEVEFPQDEIGFLTMHIVNGAHAEMNNQSSMLTDMVFESLNIIRDHYLIGLKSQDIHTQRIMIHLKMLIQRVMSFKQVDFDEPILHNVIVDFGSAYSCASKIHNYIETRLKTPINSQEMVYLTIHLNRLEQILPVGL